MGRLATWENNTTAENFACNPAGIDYPIGFSRGNPNNVLTSDQIEQTAKHIEFFSNFHDIQRISTICQWVTPLAERKQTLVARIYSTLENSVSVHKKWLCLGRTFAGYHASAEGHLRKLTEIYGEFVEDYVFQDQLKRYSMHNAEEVLSFLGNHFHVAGLLTDAIEHIDTIFTETPDLVLRLDTDPEEPNFKQIVANIVTSLDPDEALEKLDQFDDSWWLLSSSKAKGKLSFNIAFK